MDRDPPFDILVLAGLRQAFRCGRATRVTGTAAWVWKSSEPIKAPPFRGTTPLAFMTRTRTEGARDVVRSVLQQGLRGSISTRG